MSQVVELHLDEQERIDVDLLCAHCNYNLRTLRLDANCPECGLAVETSSRRDVLALAPPGWRRLAARAGTLFHWGAALAVVPPFYPGLLAGVAGLLALLVPQSGRREPSFDRVRRVVATACLAVGGPGVVVFLVALGRSIHRIGLWGNHGKVLEGTFLGVHLFVLFGLLGAWEYLEVLARRVPDMELARRCRQARWTYVASLAVIVVLGLGAQAYQRVYNQRIYALSGSMQVIVTVSIVVLMAVMLLVMWWVTLRVSGQLARRLKALAADGGNDERDH